MYLNLRHTINEMQDELKRHLRMLFKNSIGYSDLAYRALEFQKIY